MTGARGALVWQCSLCGTRYPEAVAECDCRKQRAGQGNGAQRIEMRGAALSHALRLPMRGRTFRAWRAAGVAAVHSALTETGGNVRHAAALLGVAERTLHGWLRRHPDLAGCERQGRMRW